MTRFLWCAALIVALVPVVRAQDGEKSVDVPRELGGFVMRAHDGRVDCSEASAEEMAAMHARDASEPLHVISAGRTGKLAGTAGLTIVLRGTPQLDGFPLAREAFLRAAAEWESRISTPITMIVDVDFGPTRFGTPYPAGVIGSTDPQYGNSVSYTTMRQRLIDRAPTAQAAALYQQLPPAPSVPTTDGVSSSIFPPVAVLRALGFENPVADPVAEQNRLGDPPSIGFNSGFVYDFDQSNGIDNGKTDFTGAAIHEIGHALGFVSWSGLQELVPSAPNVLSTWDLFRFRPGVSLATFGSGQRVVTSGGDHVYFTGGAPLALSTGRPDGSGGDGRQASHWKDNFLTHGNYIGVMDPTIDDGEMIFVTANDEDALSFFGFRVGDPPAVSGLTSDPNGDQVTFTGSVTDPNGDIDLSSFKFEALDRADAVLGTLVVVSAGVVGDTGALNFTVVCRGLTDLPTAAIGRVTVLDSRGNLSTATVDLGLADPGGPTLNKVKYKKGKLTIDGTPMTGTLQIEVNGVVVAPPATIKSSKGGRRLVVKGDPATLGLVAGQNSIRVLANGLRSNILKLNVSP